MATKKSKSTTQQTVKRVDEILVSTPTDVEMSIEHDMDTYPDRRIVIRGVLNSGERFRITINGNFAIKYQVQDEESKEINTLYKE